MFGEFDLSEKTEASSRGEDEKIEAMRERDSWDRCRFLVLSGPSRQHRIPLTVSPVLDALADYRYGKILHHISISPFLLPSNFIPREILFRNSQRSNVDGRSWILSIWKKKIS